MRRLVLVLALTMGCSGSAPAPPGPIEQPRASEETQPAPTPPDVPEAADLATSDTWLQAQLERYPDKFGDLLADPAHYRLQILVTLVTPREGGPPALEEHGVREGAEFVYPASAIKTFASVAALLRLQALQADGHRVSVNTPLALCRGNAKRCTKREDETNLEGGLITLGHEIRKMQLVSDNRSFNRLYDFVGHREFNEVVWSLGFPEVRLHHRMFDSDDPAVRRTTPRMELLPAKGKPVVIPRRVSDLELPATPAPGLDLGVAYFDEDRKRIEESMSFADKNYASIRDLHRLTIALAMPDAPDIPKLGLSDEHRKFLLEAMTQDPHASANPVYTKPIHSGLRYKTMIRGMIRAMPLTRIQYTGKPGRAYGFHLDSAYIEDKKTHRAMFVTTVIYANANGVLNDNVYEHDEVTRPYLKNLGEVLVRAWFLGE